MPTLLTETDLFAMALDLLEEEPVSDPDEDRAPVRWLKRNAGPVRDALLRRHGWNFALARASLEAEAEAPAFGWTHAYALPQDCLRLLPLKSGGALNGRPIPHELEGNLVLTDASAPLLVRYVKRVEDPAAFDPLFAEALATALAARMAHWMTGKQSYAERLAQSLKDLLAEASLVDTLEGTPEASLADDVLDAREWV